MMISIVIPVRDRAQKVKATLESIVAQSYRPINVVLVDNGSNDDTLGVLNRWREENYSENFTIEVLCQPKGGACAARNLGLNRADAAWVMFFDSDDIMAPSHVERAVAAAKEHPEAEIIGWDVELRHLDGHKSIERFYKTDALFHCIHHGSMATQRYMARKALFESQRTEGDMGVWREDVRVWNDIELGTRLLLAAGENPEAIVALKGAPTVEVIAGANSITGVKYSEKWKQRDYAIDCMIASLPAAYRWMAHLKRAILAALCYCEGNIEAASTLMKRISEKSISKYCYFLCLMAYHYTRHGGKGIARLLRPLFP